MDAHSDTNDTMLGEKIAHGTPFRRAMEEGCLDGHKVIQIGLRGSNYSLDDYDWGKKQVIHFLLTLNVSQIKIVEFAKNINTAKLACYELSCLDLQFGLCC